MSLSAAPSDLARQIADAVMALPPSPNRQLIAVAGPPGSGKTTVAELARQELDLRGHPTGVLAMDGFHFDNAVLAGRGLIERKGAPETFDTSGFIAMLHRLLDEDEVAVPTFDRKLDKAIAASAVIGPKQRTVIVEGNYLLLEQEGWRACGGLWALRAFLDVPFPELERRLIERWTAHGLEAHLARQRALSNDIPNAELVVERSKSADLVLT